MVFKEGYPLDSSWTLAGFPLHVPPPCMYDHRRSINISVKIPTVHVFGRRKDVHRAARIIAYFYRSTIWRSPRFHCRVIYVGMFKCKQVLLRLFSSWLILSMEYQRQLLCKLYWIREFLWKNSRDERNERPPLVKLHKNIRSQEQGNDGACAEPLPQCRRWTVDNIKTISPSMLTNFEVAMTFKRL